jgi:alpha-beta hydrolase superfamily lysophospholipase
MRNREAAIAAAGLSVVLAACAAPLIVDVPDAGLEPRLGVDHARMPDGYRLPLRVWPPGAQAARRAADDETAVVVLGLHGFNDYGNAFQPLAEDLAASGIVSYAVDQRGFGATALAGRWHGSERLAADLAVLTGLLKHRHPDAGLYLIGESMGGAVVISALARYSLPIDGSVLIAPAVWSRASMPWYQRTALDAIVRIAPWLRLTGEGVSIRPSDNLEMLRAMGTDPLVIKATRVDALWGVTNLMDRAMAAVPALRGPLLLLYGEQDDIIPREAFCRMLQRLPSQPERSRLALYRHGWHMLPRDLQGARVRADIVAWLRDDVPLPSRESFPFESPRVRAFCGAAPLEPDEIHRPTVPVVGRPVLAGNLDPRSRIPGREKHIAVDLGVDQRELHPIGAGQYRPIDARTTDDHDLWHVPGGVDRRGGRSDHLTARTRAKAGIAGDHQMAPVRQHPGQ